MTTAPEGLEAIFAGAGATPVVYDPKAFLAGIVGHKAIERFERAVERVVDSELDFHAAMIEAAWILTRADMRYTLYEEGLDAERWIEDFGRFDPWTIACRLPPRGATYELIGFDQSHEEERDSMERRFSDVFLPPADAPSVT